jgi:ATP-binding cassette, subfamily B, bacterial
MSAIDSLRRFARGVATILQLGFAADPVRAALLLTGHVIAAGASLVSTYSIKYVAQEALTGQREGAVAAAAILVLTLGLAMAASLYNIRFAYRLAEAIGLHLDSELIRLTAKIPTLEYQDRPAYADKMDLIRSERRQLAYAMQAIVGNLQVLIFVLGFLSILISVDASFAVLPLFAVPRALAGRRAQRRTKQGQDASAEPGRLRARLYARAASAAAGKEIRIFGLDDELLRRVRALTSRMRQPKDRANWDGALWLSLGDLVFMAACVGAIAWTVIRAAEGRASLGDVVLVASMAAGLVGLMAGALATGMYLATMLATVERFNWLADFAAAASRPPDRPVTLPAQLHSGIRVDGVSFTYPDCEKPVLSDISFDLPSGQVVALVGENGSGKSTLVKLLCGLYRPSVGRILLDGTDLADVPIAQWRGRITAAFQDFTNFELIVEESVALGDLTRPASRQRVVDALERAGAGDLMTLQPSGLDSLLGKKWGGIELSGGQWQKLALGRAIIRHQPLLVLFDEPAAALDAVAEHDLFQRFAAEARTPRTAEGAAGRVTLLVSHRFSTVRMADLIIVLADGRIVESGSHDALMRRGGLYAELFELQARAYR